VLARSGSRVRIPRAALMLWHYRGDLQQAFSGDDRGAEQLAQWFKTAVQQEPGLCWLEPRESKQVSAPSPRQRKTRPFGVNLIGFAFGQLGIGEDVRMAVAACEAAAIPFKVVNV